MPRQAMRWLFLLVLLLLVPAGWADHQPGRPIVRIDLDDDERDDRKDKGHRGKDKERADREGDRDKDRDDGRDDDREGRGQAAVRPAPARNAGLAQGCMRASGGATTNGNAVAWPAQEGPVEVWRRSGEGEWERVHEAEPGASLHMDHDLRKGRAYAYRVVEPGSDPDACPALEMTAVPFFAGWASAFVVAAAAGVYMVLGRR